jgi:alkylation response protein AidB-like acyl-CoA dehydrogenase
VSISPTLAEFTAEATAFVSSHARPRTDEFVWGKGSDVIPFFDGVDDEHVAIVKAKGWAQTRFDAGFGWVAGPAEYGGRGLPMPYDLAYRIVESEFDVPDTSHLELGMGMVGPTVLAWGTPELREKFLRALYRGDLVACQLFSEPEAGSDLAAVKTTAVRKDEGWLISGQKVWTSDAQHSQLGLALTRSNPEVAKHKGLTMFLVDMDTPGVQIRPLRQMTGGAHFNEVFFDDVFVPDDRRLGDVDGGWRVALTTLMNERGSVGTGPPATMAALSHRRLMALAEHVGMDRDPVTRQDLGALYTGFTIARYLDEIGRARVLSGADPGPEASVLKLMFSANLTAAATLATDLLGPSAAADTGEWGTFSWSNFLLATPALRILGGTEEIMKNVIAERVLGLPKEPAPG